MSDLQVQNLRRAFGSVVALDGISFNVADGEFFCLLGPSASGKTTTLRAIAGLEELEAGRVLFGGSDVTKAPVQGRGVGAERNRRTRSIGVASAPPRRLLALLYDASQLRRRAWALVAVPSK